MYGRANVPAAAKPKELRSTERRLKFLMSVVLPALEFRALQGHVSMLLSNIEHTTPVLKALGKSAIEATEGSNRSSPPAGLFQQ
jgi:hypothetical protein